MVRYWGAFVRQHRPGVRDLTAWPSYSSGHTILSLRPGGRSTLITNAAYAREHQCSFWTAGQ
jgi:para-nitrobenzyl esterase